MGGLDLAARSYELLLARTYDALKLVSDDVNVIGGALASHGQDKPGVAPPDAFADRVHQGSRRRVPRDEAHASDHGHVRDPSVLDPVEVAADVLAPADDDDRRCRLPEARQAAHDCVPRHGAARRDAADRLRRVRLPVEDSAGNALRLQPPRVRGRGGRDPGVAAGEVLRAGVRARGVPADRRRDADLPRRRRARRARVAVGPLLRQRPAEDEPARPSAPRRSPRSRGRSPQCDQDKTTANVDDVVFSGPSASAPDTLQTGFTCNLPCTYQLQILDATTGKPVASAGGKAVGLTTVKIPTTDLKPGRYEYALRAFKCGKPETAETRFSTAFALGVGRREGEAVADTRAGRSVIRVIVAAAVVAAMVSVGSSSAAKPKETPLHPYFTAVFSTTSYSPGTDRDAQGDHAGARASTCRSCAPVRSGHGRASASRGGLSSTSTSAALGANLVRVRLGAWTSGLYFARLTTTTGDTAYVRAVRRPARRVGEKPRRRRAADLQLAGLQLLRRRRTTGAATRGTSTTGGSTCSSAGRSSTRESRRTTARSSAASSLPRARGPPGGLPDATRISRRSRPATTSRSATT